MSAGLRPVVNVLRLRGLPLLSQLRLEEALLRADDRNWCILNDGAGEEPTIVLGISGKPDKLVHVEEARSQGVPLVKRYSGGGTVRHTHLSSPLSWTAHPIAESYRPNAATEIHGPYLCPDHCAIQQVIVDDNTIMSTLILRQGDVPQVKPFPRNIMEWSGTLYQPLFSQWGDFRVRENDYVIGDMKFGGNAQAITKNRWVHHTSFLWDMDPARMAMLKHPEKKPEYRQERGHMDFLCTMKRFTSHRGQLLSDMERCLHSAGFEPRETSLSEAQEALEKPHMKSTVVL